jgi:hypothetical protein
VVLDERAATGEQKMSRPNQVGQVFGIMIPLFMGYTVLPASYFLIPSSTGFVIDRHTGTFQIDFKRALNERDVRETLRDFNGKLVRASNNFSRSERWSVDIETREADNKVERELKATKGVDRVKRVLIKPPDPSRPKQ